MSLAARCSCNCWAMGVSTESWVPTPRGGSGRGALARVELKEERAMAPSGPLANCWWRCKLPSGPLANCGWRCKLPWLSCWRRFGSWGALWASLTNWSGESQKASWLWGALATKLVGGGREGWGDAERGRGDVERGRGDVERGRGDLDRPEGVKATFELALLSRSTEKIGRMNRMIKSGGKNKCFSKREERKKDQNKV